MEAGPRTKPMQINPHSGSGEVGRTPPRRPTVPPLKTAGDGVDAAAFSRTEALHRALAEMPAVRPEAVARARQLLGQPQYPPLETIRGIARLLALPLGSEEP